MDIFQFNDPLDVLKAMIAANESVPSYKPKIAKNADIHPSYLTRLLKKEATLNLDQAVKLCQFWSFNDLESEFFIELNLLVKAASQESQAYFQARLEKIRKAKRSVSTLVGQKQPVLETEARAKYYSDWLHTAVHMLPLIKEFRTPEKIAARLREPVERIEDCIRSLEAMGLLMTQGGHVKSARAFIHVSRQDPFFLMNHTHFRLKATEAASRGKDLVAYSSLMTVSRKDINRINDQILALIKQIRDLATSSRDEDVVCFNCDLFQV